MSIEAEHEKVVEHLQNIKNEINEMGEEGLGGPDFEGLYLLNKLIPVIEKIFRGK
jgi:hypothetical protein